MSTIEADKLGIFSVPGHKVSNRSNYVSWRVEDRIPAVEVAIPFDKIRPSFPGAQFGMSLVARLIKDRATTEMIQFGTNPAKAFQRERIKSLSSHVNQEGGLPVSPAAQVRANEVLDALWSVVGLDDVIERAFITATGTGDLQLEWQAGDRYFEVEVPVTGPLSVYWEKSQHSGQTTVSGSAQLGQLFQNFWWFNRT